MSFDEEMKKVNKWCIKQGLDILKDSDFVVNKIERINEKRLQVTAFINIYLTNGDLYTTTIQFEIEKRKEKNEKT